MVRLAMSIGNKSPELKAERGYTDPKSFVRPDGTEVLFNEDWHARKLELWARCKGFCEWMGTPEKPFPMICYQQAEDPHHIIPRRDGRDDRLANLQALCRYHHNLLDRRIPRFGEGRGESA